MKPAAAVLAFFLLLPLTISADSDHANAMETRHAGEDAWQIDDEFTCVDETLVIDQNITVLPGGSLELRGCTLRMDTPAYDDVVYSRQDEGLVIHVAEGGELRLLSTHQESAIQRADPRYGYTIKVDGKLVVEGTPDHPATITGLEGAYQGRLAFGGMQVRGGEASLHHAVLHNNTGPSLFVIAGADAELEDVHVEGNGGLIASNARRLAISNLTGNVPFSVLSISSTEEARLRGCDLESHTDTISVAYTALDVRDCHVKANLTTVSAIGAAVTLDDVELDFGARAINAGVSPQDVDRHEMKMDINDVRFHPRAEATVAIASIGHDVQISGSVFHGSDLPVALNFSGPGGLDVMDSTFATGASPTVYATNPANIEMLRNEYAATDPVLIRRVTTVAVVGVPDEAMDGATISMQNQTTHLDEAGVGRLPWVQWRGGDVRSESLVQAVEVKLAHGDKVIVSQEMDADTVYARLAWPGDTSIPWMTAAAYLAGGLVVGLAWVYVPRAWAWSKRHRDRGPRH